LLDAVHSCEVEDDAAMQRDSLAVVAGSRAAGGDRKIVDLAVTENVLDFGGGERLDDEVADLSVELFAEHRRIPVEIAGELLDSLGMGEDARRIAEE
jgi:hypothetical protein